ncbi:WD40 repeat domain-containing protein [Streptomyces chrestomyceticus]|uniref:WD40 repeat domain-containing protein n=1 Tax=Streptomyces chrestomyceticus TaxID=68185 RepID=UPI0033C5FCCD
MGRREKPVDPGAGPVQRFAYELRKLRLEAGSPTYRAMAERAAYSAAVLSQAAAGEKLPSLPVTLAYVTACGGDTGHWQRRWHEAVREDAARVLEAEEDGAVAPYRGLARFEPDDHTRYFGRRRLTEELLRRVRERRVVAVFGPSGSGKSSLLRAGLIARLRQPADAPPLGLPPPAAIRVLTPGARPERDAGRLFTPAGTTGDTWLVVDQFEEVFTLCADPEERNAFVRRVLTAHDPARRLRVVLGVRADFYGRCLAHRELADVIHEASLPIGPMTPQELREAIVKPAAAEGLIVERSLTARLVEEMAEEPGSLPLLSHVLLETWRRRRGRTLTLQAYEAAGGVHGAVAQTAEQLYGRLSPQQAATARRMLLRLITPGEGSADTRRPAARGELDAGDPAAAQLVEQLARARLITVDQDTVDLAHEALITSWPRLRGWIEEDRGRLIVHRRLTEAAGLWHELDHDPGALYRGTRLDAAEEAFAPEEGSVPEERGAAEGAAGPAPSSVGAPDELTPLERAFLTASIAARDRERRAAARTTRRLRQSAATLSVLLALALAAGLVAWDQFRTSERQRDAAVAAQRLSLSRQLAAQSTALMGDWPDLSSLLAVHAYRTAPTKEAVASLFSAVDVPLRRRLDAHSGGVRAVAFSPDGRTLATGGARDATVRLWNVPAGTARATLPAPAKTLAALSFSADGRTLAGSTGGGAWRLWDVATGRTRATFGGHGGPVATTAFSRDGRILATGGTDGTVRLWDTATGELSATLRGHTGKVVSVAFAPDGRSVATGSLDGTVRLWDAATGAARARLESPAGTNRAVAFGPDGRTLAIYGGNEASIKLWDVTAGKARTTLAGPAGYVIAMVFGPSGRFLGGGSDDGTVRLWDVATGANLGTLPGHARRVNSVAFSPDGHTMASGSDDGTVRLWNTALGDVLTTLTGHSGPVGAVAYGRGGRTLASGSDDGTVRVWDLGTRGSRTLGRRSGSGGSDRVRAVAFSPDGRTLATTGRRTGLRIWDVATGRLLATLHRFTGEAVAFSPDGRTLAGTGGTGALLLWDTRGHRTRTLSASRTDPATSVAFSRDGRTLASGSRHGPVRLWDVATGRARKVLTGPRGDAGAVAFSPDGRTLAGGGADGSVRLWDTITGRARTTITGQTIGALGAVAFSPDGRTLAASGRETGSVRLWDVATGQARATYAGQTGLVRSVAFSPDGRSLATGSSDGVVRLREVALPGPDESVRRICRAVNRELTPAEHAAYLPDEAPRKACGAS